MMHSKGLAKLVEECGELIRIAGKLIAFPDKHPSGLNCRQELIDELADVLAACQFVANKYQLDINELNKRRLEKLQLYKHWDAGN